MQLDVHPRVVGAERAVARFGELASRCFAALERCDPPADALVEWLGSAQAPATFNLDEAWAHHEAGRELPAPVADLFAAVAQPPPWVDWPAIDRARRLFERTGMFGGLVLSLRALMGGYIAPAGNKPLAFSGRLREQAPRRVAETSRFVTAVCAPGGVRPGAPGFMITLQVRIMHAQVRRLLRLSGRWRDDLWAAPLNQHDMCATMLLFSEVYVEGLRLFGFDIDEREAEDWIQLWRYVAWLMGTEADLLPRDFAEAAAMRELIQRTQGEPDADSRALAAALLQHPPELPGARRLGRWREQLDHELIELRLGLAREISRMLIGDEVADKLDISRSSGWARVVPALPVAVGAFEGLRKRVPGLEARLRSVGARYWDWIVELSLAGKPASFAPPISLGRS